MWGKIEWEDRQLETHIKDHDTYYYDYSIIDWPTDQVNHFLDASSQKNLILNYKREITHSNFEYQTDIRIDKRTGRYL